MANALHDKEWYDKQVQHSIKTGFSYRSFRGANVRQSATASSNGNVLPHRSTFLETTLACLTTYYKQAAANVLAVGAIIGGLDKYIRNEIWRPQWPNAEKYTTFCIGLSLGTHTCGFIGKSHKMVNH